MLGACLGLRQHRSVRRAGEAGDRYAWERRVGGQGGSGLRLLHEWRPGRHSGFGASNKPSGWRAGERASACLSCRLQPLPPLALLLRARLRAGAASGERPSTAAPVASCRTARGAVLQRLRLRDAQPLCTTLLAHACQRDIYVTP